MTNTDLDWVMDKISAEIIQERLDVPCTTNNVCTLAKLLKEFEFSRSNQSSHESKSSDFQRINDPDNNTGDANFFDIVLKLRLDCTRI